MISCMLFENHVLDLSDEMCTVQMRLMDAIVVTQNAVGETIRYKKKQKGNTYVHTQHVGPDQYI